MLFLACIWLRLCSTHFTYKPSFALYDPKWAWHLGSTRVAWMLRCFGSGFLSLPFTWALLLTNLCPEQPPPPLEEPQLLTVQVKLHGLLESKGIYYIVFPYSLLTTSKQSFRAWGSEKLPCNLEHAPFRRR